MKQLEGTGKHQRRHKLFTYGSAACVNPDVFGCAATFIRVEVEVGDNVEYFCFCQENIEKGKAVKQCPGSEGFRPEVQPGVASWGMQVLYDV